MSDCDESFLDELRAAGRFDSEGAFSENVEQLLGRLSTRLFEDDQEYLLCFLRALLLSGAKSITWEASIQSVEISAIGARLEPLQGQWPPLAIDRAAGGRRWLAAGLVGAWKEHPEIFFESCGQAWTYRPEQGTDPKKETASGSETRIWFKRPRPKLSLLHKPQPRTLAYPVPIFLSSILGSGETQQANAYSTQGEPLILPNATLHPDNITNRIEGVYALGNGPLAVPGQLAGAPVFWDSETERKLWFSCKMGQKQTPFYGAERLLLMRRPLSGPSYLILVEAGIALRPLMVDLGYPGLAVFCSLEEEGLESDLSGGQVLENAALETLVAEIRSHLPDWMRAFSKAVSTWKPGIAHDPNVMPALGAGFFGFAVGVGLFAASGFFFPPFTAVASAYMADRAYASWKKRRIQEELREVLDSPAQAEPPSP